MNAEMAAEVLVGVATPIKNDPELLEAFRQATDYYEKSIKAHNLDPAKRELLWGCSGEPMPSNVLPSLSESDRYGTRHASKLITRKRMLDHVSRELTINDLILDVLSQRWYQIGKVINQGIEELEREEMQSGKSN